MASGSSRVLWITVFAMGSGSSRVLRFTVFAMTGGSSRVLWFTVFAMASGSSRVIVHGICNGEWFFTAVVHGICNGEWFFTGYSSRYLQWGVVLHGCGSRYLQWRVVLHGLWFTVFAMVSGSSRVMVHDICNGEWFFTGYTTLQSNTKNRGVPNVAFTSNLHFKQSARA